MSILFVHYTQIHRSYCFGNKGICPPDHMPRVFWRVGKSMGNVGWFFTCVLAVCTVQFFIISVVVP